MVSVVLYKMNNKNEIQFWWPASDLERVLMFNLFSSSHNDMDNCKYLVVGCVNSSLSYFCFRQIVK